MRVSGGARSSPAENLADKEPLQTPDQQIKRAKNERTKPFRIVKMKTHWRQSAKRFGSGLAWVQEKLYCQHSQPNNSQCVSEQQGKFFHSLSFYNLTQSNKLNLRTCVNG
ncbi:hypothetical protein M8494_02170 [Serratia ureilytica]